MTGLRLRKQDSDVRVVKRLVRQEVAQKLGSSAAGTGANFLQHYSYGAGGGGSFGGSGQATASAIKADVVADGSVATVSRGKLQATGGAFIEDNVGEDAVRVRVHAVNDPMYWLG